MQDHDMTYEYLVGKFGKKEFDERYDNIKARIQSYIDKSGAADLYVLNETMLKDAITDYYVDIDRLKSFQEIEHTNKNKITSYTAYWLLRRKPIQIVCDNCTDYKLIYPNEEFVTTLIMKDYLSYDSELFKGMYCVQELSKYVFYFLKYRITTPQSLELFLEGVHAGIEMGIGLQKKHVFQDAK